MEVGLVSVTSMLDKEGEADVGKRVWESGVYLVNSLLWRDDLDRRRKRDVSDRIVLCDWKKTPGAQVC